MWYSIESIITPETLAEAYSLQQRKGAVVFSGGSYLVAKKNPSVRQLVDINNLLDNTVRAESEAVQISAGTTLQSFIDSVKVSTPNCRLMESVSVSCPSKQLRNQRTFGGEVGQNRPNSEVLVFLHAVNADLTIYTDSVNIVPIREWDGDGIITGITYSTVQISGIELQRFSVLQSAPAIVIVVGCRRPGQFDIAVGGTAQAVQTFTVPVENWSDKTPPSLAQKAVNQFFPDHFGSLSYKESLISTALQRVKAAL